LFALHELPALKGSVPSFLKNDRGLRPNRAHRGYGRWIHIDGFSEGVLRFIREMKRKP